MIASYAHLVSGEITAAEAAKTSRLLRSAHAKALGKSRDV